MLLKNWLRSLKLRVLGVPVSRRRLRSNRLEHLENRCLLATVTWDGGGSADNWNDPLNWTGDALPTSVDDVLFSGGATTVVLDVNADVQSVTFATAGWVLNPGPSFYLTVNTGISIQAGTNVTMNAPVNFSGSGAISLLGAGTQATFAAPIKSAVAGLANLTLDLSSASNQVLNLVGSIGTGGTNPGGAFNNITLNGNTGATLVTGNAANTVTVLSTGTQTYNSNISLLNDATFRSTGIGAFGNITLGAGSSSTINTPAGTQLRNLTVLSDGTSTLNAVVGGGAANTSLNTVTTGGNTFSTSGTTQINFNVTTRAVSLAGPPVTILPSQQIYGNAVNLSGTRTLTSTEASDVPTTGTIRFASTLNALVADAASLTVVNSGVTQFQGSVGAVRRLTSLTTDFPSTTVPLTTPRFNERTEFGSGTASLLTVQVGTMTFNEPVDVQNDTTMTTGGATGSTGNVRFNAGLYSTSGADLTVVTNGTTFFGNGTATSVSIANGAPRSPFTVGDYVGYDPWNEVARPLGSLTTDFGGTTLFNILAATVDFPTVETFGNQEYGDDVDLQRDSVFQSRGTVAGSADIWFRETLDSFSTPVALELNTGGNTIFGDGQDDTVGVGVGIASILTDNSNAPAVGGHTIFDIVATGTDVFTTAQQNYQDAVWLLNNTDLESVGPTVGGITIDGNIEFDSTVDTHPTAGTFRALSVSTSANSVFADQVGASRELLSILTDAEGRTQFTRLGSQDIRTIRRQVYTDDVQLRGWGRFSASDPALSFLWFRSTVDSLIQDPLGVDPSFYGTLSLFSPGVKAFGDGVGNDSVGSVIPLLDFTTDGTGATQFNVANSTVVTSGSTRPTVTTLRHQAYNNDVELLRDTVLVSQNVIGNGNLQILGVVTNPVDRRLSLNVGGDTLLAGKVGTPANPLDSLFISELAYSGRRGIARLNIPGGTGASPSIVTRNNQYYGTDTVLVVDQLLQSVGSGSIQFASRLDSSAGTFRSLTVQTQGNTDIGTGGHAYVGSIQPLESFSTDVGGTTRFNVNGPGNPGQVRPPTVRTRDNQNYNDTVILQQYTTLDSTLGAVNLNGTILSNQFLLTVDLPLSGPWFDVSNNGLPVRVIQDGTSVIFIDRVGNVNRGSVNSATSPTSGSVTGLGSFSIGGDTIQFADGIRWVRTNLTGYYNAAGSIATISQDGASLTFTRPDGSVSTGTWTADNQVRADEFAATAVFNNGSLQWTVGPAWSHFQLSPTYTVGGRIAQVIMNGLSITLINENGQSSPATLQSPTLISAFGMVGQITQGQIRWSNNTVWRKELTISGTTTTGAPVRVHMTDTVLEFLPTSGPAIQARAISRTSFQLSDGRTAILANGRFLFNNGIVWQNFRQSDLDALFSDVQRFPFPA